MRKAHWLLILITFIYAKNSFSQNLISISGSVIDEKSSVPIEGVSIYVNDVMKTISDENGLWELTLEKGSYKLKFSYLGYESLEKSIDLQKSMIDQNIILKEKYNYLDEIVVSSTKYGKKISEETKSISVLKIDAIKNSNPTSVSDVLSKIPGIYVMDGQVNMRGGTGFTQGAGSRVQLIVDDLPLITADKGDTKWIMVPLENVDQIEVLKGAESVLYGSSALNGVVQVATAWPSIGPIQNDFTLNVSSIGNPEHEISKWWKTPPTSLNFSGVHKKKLENKDLVLGYAAGRLRSHLVDESKDYARLNFKTRFHDKKIKNLNYGINGNMMYLKESVYFLWQDADTNIMKPFGGEYGTDGSSILHYRNLWMSLDPHATFYSKNDAKTIYRGRIYFTNIYNDENKITNKCFIAYNEIQHSNKFQEYLNYTLGGNYTFFNVKDDKLKSHHGNKASTFLQATFQKGRFTYTQGLRLEHIAVDTISTFLPPIYEVGLNVKLASKTYIRASAGQGYRLPSVTEQNVVDNLGSITIFPNPDLLPEEGWNAELACKQGFTLSSLNGYVDLAFFLTENKNLTEFKFDYYNFPFQGQQLNGIGFRSMNIPLSRVTGLDITTQASGRIGVFPIQFIGGYTYSFPLNLSESDEYKDYGKYFQKAFYAINHTDSTIMYNIMKYRFRHIARIDIESGWNRVTFGGACNYYSDMNRVDDIFTIFMSSINDYMERDHGNLILQARIGYKFSDKSAINIVISNVANKEYALRPGKLDAPRSISIQYKLKLI